VSTKLSTNFWSHEFECKCGCGFDEINQDLVNLLQLVRDHFGKTVHVNSGCRCIPYNRSIGSKDTSQHPKGTAADIRVTGVTPEKVYEYLEEQDFQGGLGLYSDFVHVDVRGYPARW
jgi:uncharacterized protein YcbK (DUF882 family)